MPNPEVAVVILTMGDRPVELTRAIESAQRQRDVDVDVIVVANGRPAASLGDLGAAVRVVESSENVGIPGGRNLGAAAASAPLLAFLDDDARFLDDQVLARAAGSFQRCPDLGVVALRIVEPSGETARRHVPRLGARDPARSGPVTAFLGGAAVVRRAAFEAAGGYAAPFFYAMEETDLAWRLVDRGWSLHYDGHPAVEHPATEPSRHAGHAERTMRNRVWMAHRCLPAPLVVAYVTSWALITTARRPALAWTIARTIGRAWRTRPGPRRPMRWGTVWHLTRTGRPPVV